MKKFILAIIAIAFVTNMGQAQDAKKALKKASKSVASYFLDPQSNKDRLKEAAEQIEIAAAGEETAALFKTWETRGKIYNEVASQINITRQLGTDASYLPKVENPAIKAFDSYLKAQEFATKKSLKKKVFEGFTNVQANLYAIGLYAYEDKAYEAAFLNFKGVIDVHEILKAAQKPSTLDDKSLYTDQYYATALAAELADKKDMAKIYYEKLYADKAEKPAIYTALYNMTAEDDLDGAYKYLTEGRTLFPDDIGLLFAEINHFLKQGKLDELIAKIKSAIEKEPNNISLYSTLGNVYDNLYQKESEAGNTEKADGYFTDALNYYNLALTKDANYFDAIYSIGALYYNKAAAFTVKENKTLEQGVSKALMKEADEYKALANDSFEKAFPFFKKAEMLNPNDMNTLIALKEVLVRKDDLTSSKEIKMRLDKIRDGGKNETSFYKN